MATGTLEILALEMARALRPLEDRLRPTEIRGLFAELGLDFPPALETQAGLVGALGTAASAVAGLGPLAVRLVSAVEAEDVPDMVKAAVDIAGIVRRLVPAFETIGNQLQGLSGSFPGMDPGDVTAFAGELAGRLLESTLVEYLEGYHPVVLQILALLGIAELAHVPGDGANAAKPPHTRKRLRLERLADLLESPENLLRSLYGWGDPGFDGRLLLQRLQALLSSLSIPASYAPAATPPGLRLFLLRVSPRTDLAPPGLEVVLELSLPGDVTESIPIFDPQWSLEIGLGAALEAQAGFTVQPPADVSLVTPSGSVQGNLSVGVTRSPRPGQPSIVLLGVAGGSGLMAQRVSVSLVSTFLWDSASSRALGDFGFEGKIQGGKLIVSLDGADGFVGEILSGFGLEADFDVGFGWRASGGVYFTGSGALEIQIPVHITLGPVELNALTFTVGIEGRTFPIGLATDIKASLGPLQAVVEQVGVLANLSFPADGKGGLGPVDFSLAFQPPRGVGLSIDTGIVRGGGYLFIDAERGEYAGALELTFSGFLSLKAIGIITTKNPDGSPGFSLLILITAEFESGLQLGFGFALFAVGGLLGLNRTMKLQPLMEGVRSGGLNSIMFPQNVVANAPKIISDLRTIFPPQQGTFLIGPMAKLGWGTPPLISVSLGIIIEIPGNIAILGVLKVALPTEKAPVLIIQVNFAGAIEFDKKRLYFFAALFESRVLFITIEGEMGLLVAFGDDANFVVSVGGFHPRFSPPPLPFPSPIRVALNLINESWARVRVEGYFAVTSNSVQFGAAVEVFFGVSAFNVKGHLAFDALFQFSPFFFVISISASFSVTVFGIGLFSVRFSGSLEGPTPWRVAGEGSISILFFDISVDFEVTWGETNKATLPPIEVLPVIRAELNKAESWRALPPAGNNLSVSLRKMPAEEAALVLHPVGVLRVSQRAIPFALTLGKVGNQKPSDVNRLTIGVAGGGLAQKAEAFEPFAPAQFQEMSDAEKLSRPAFSKERSGLELSAAGEDLRTAGMTRRVVRYEEIIIDSNFKRFVFRFRLLGALLFNFFLGGAAVARSELSLAKKKQYEPFAEKIEVKDATYTVAFQANNKAYSPAAATFTSEASAQEFLRAEASKDANLADSLHVIPSWERAA